MSFWNGRASTLKEHIDNGEIANWRNFETIRDTMYPTCMLDFQLKTFGKEHEKDLSIFKNHCSTQDDFTGLVNQYYNLSIYRNVVGKDPVEFSSIIEFGGGYGALVRVLTLLGYKGKYTIIDLPELVKIQQQYLYTEQKLDLEIEWTDINVSGADLFWATWSLSEVSKDRPSIEEFDCKSHMIGYCRVWESFDNIKYFSDFVDNNKNKYNFWTQDTYYNSVYLMSYKNEEC